MLESIIEYLKILVIFISNLSIITKVLLIIFISLFILIQLRNIKLIKGLLFYVFNINRFYMA